MSSKFIVQSAAGYDHFMGGWSLRLAPLLIALPGFMMAIGDIRRGELRLKTGPPLSAEAHGRGSKRPGCFAPADPI